MTSKKHEFILRPIERNDLSEVNEMLRDGRMEIFPEFFKSEIIYNYKLQIPVFMVCFGLAYLINSLLLLVLICAFYCAAYKSVQKFRRLVYC